MKKTNNKKGFVILFVVLISTTILLITASIFNVSIKEVILSSYAGESQIAFYNADSALECALYSDIQGAIFDTTAPATSVDVDCTGQTFTADVFTATTSFSHIYGFRYNDLNALGCSYVFVEKRRVNQGGGIDEITTRITGIGYNTCTGTTPAIPDFDDPILLERRLSIEYVQTTPTV